MNRETLLIPLSSANIACLFDLRGTISRNIVKEVAAHSLRKRHEISPSLSRCRRRWWWTIGGDIAADYATDLDETRPPSTIRSTRLETSRPEGPIFLRPAGLAMPLAMQSSSGIRTRVHLRAPPMASGLCGRDYRLDRENAPLLLSSSSIRFYIIDSWLILPDRNRFRALLYIPRISFLHIPSTRYPRHDRWNR